MEFNDLLHRSGIDPKKAPVLVWSRWADKNAVMVDAIVDESVFASELANWRELVLSWNDLHLISQRWKDVLSRWRGLHLVSTKTNVIID